MVFSSSQIATFGWTLAAAVLGAFATFAASLIARRRHKHRQVIEIRRTLEEALILGPPTHANPTHVRYIETLLASLDELLLDTGGRYALRAAIANARIRLEESLRESLKGNRSLERVQNLATELIALLPSKSRPCIT